MDRELRRAMFAEWEILFEIDICVISFPQGLLISCNQMSAEYLFMTDKQYDISYDTGDKVIQCGRHNDIFKLWLLEDIIKVFEFG